MAHRHFLKALHTPYLSVPRIIPTLASCYAFSALFQSPHALQRDLSVLSSEFRLPLYRSCMSNERLNSLTLLHVHTDIAIYRHSSGD